ncbi:class II aldolase/adducin family protein [Tengunoibacter tsumagoiensis]|uniref:Fuculose phosphate aldolase n=1 Tax=Tengunoibacter tsumagoiensis TaxID=2014871 RepID=A0A402A2Y6_9CHLR|nr:class II aldolase/adducin family protein [Tengunoibacter tsumagoiensis]GCE13409.1 fuculose phosphate aldolase [Tengunoibacter tsumagoiensis]
MLLPDLREEVARYAQKMYASGLVRATQGNLSARDPSTQLICITPSGADYQTLLAEDIVVVDAFAHVVEGRWKPSVETPLHTYILRRRPDIHCVMHTHSLYASACSTVYQRIPMILAESAACLGAEIPIAPYQISGTPEFAELIANTLGDGPAVIWGNHGAMVVGTTLALTFSTAHALEDTAQVYAIAKQLGTPVELSREQITALRSHWLQGYQQTSIEEKAARS